MVFVPAIAFECEAGQADTPNNFTALAFWAIDNLVMRLNEFFKLFVAGSAFKFIYWHCFPLFENGWIVVPNNFFISWAGRENGFDQALPI